MASNPSERWQLLGRVLLFLLTCALLLAAAAPRTPKLPGLWSVVILGAVTSVGTFVLTILFVRWEKLRLSQVGVAPTWQSPARLTLGIVIGLCMVAIQACIVMLCGHIKWVRTSATGGAPIGVALLAYLLLACREELAFRGYPLRRLKRAFGPWTAQILVALVFAVEHRIGGFSWWNTIVGVFIGSLLFGMAAFATNGVALPIGLHAAYNFGQWFIGEKDQPGLWKPVIEEGFKTRLDHAGMIGYLIVFGSTMLAFWWWQHKAETVPESIVSKSLDLNR